MTFKPSNGDNYEDNFNIELVVGSEQGDIQFWSLLNAEQGNYECNHIDSIEDKYCHGAAVRRMKFGGKDKNMLATCGDDNCVRIFQC